MKYNIYVTNTDYVCCLDFLANRGYHWLSGQPANEPPTFLRLRCPLNSECLKYQVPQEKMEFEKEPEIWGIRVIDTDARTISAIPVEVYTEKERQAMVENTIDVKDMIDLPALTWIDVSPNDIFHVCVTKENYREFLDFLTIHGYQWNDGKAANNPAPFLNFPPTEGIRVINMKDKRLSYLPLNTYTEVVRQSLLNQSISVDDFKAVVEEQMIHTQDMSTEKEYDMER